MSIHRRFAASPIGWLLGAVFLTVATPTTISILLPSRSFSQAERAASRIKKPLIYQIGSFVHINAEGPRPLLRALDALQEKYGWTVNYEDPQYVDEASGPTSSRWRHSNAGRSMGGSFGVEFSSGPNGSDPDENAVLTQVVEAYNQGNAVAQFELRENHINKDEASVRFSMVGIEAPDQDTAGGQKPVLDLPIALAKEKRTAEQTIALICRKINEKSDVPVTVDANDGNANTGHIRWKAPVVVGGAGEPARVLLARTLAAMGGRLCWRLLYDPAGRSYEVGISGVSQ